MSNFIVILPVLLLEYLAISIARTILPRLLIEEFGSYSYIVIGFAEAVKGLLAFWACPAIGKLSDSLGRKPFLLMSVVGTTLPTCLLAFYSNMVLYLFFFSLSGLFAGTFTLTFAYISDCVEKRKRAPAFGLALATFGLSFTVGPVVGSYVASMFGNQSVFFMSLALVLLSVLYILYQLPETVRNTVSSIVGMLFLYSFFNVLFFRLFWIDFQDDHRLSWRETIPSAYTVFETISIFKKDKFLFQVGIIIFLYYTSVVSTFCL